MRQLPTAVLVFFTGLALIQCGGCGGTQWLSPAGAAPGEGRTDGPGEETGPRPGATREEMLDSLARRASTSDEPAARVSGDVRDALTGEALHARVHLTDGGQTEPGAVLASIGFWCNGRFSVAALPGLGRLTVSAGRRRSVGSLEFLLKPGRRRKVRLDIRQPMLLRFEERGWVGVDLFRPVAGGEALRREPTLGLLALAARAEGVAFVGAASPWTVRGFRTGEENFEDVRRRCLELSDERMSVSPVVRGTDCPLYGSAFFLGAREPRRIASPGWSVRRPNFLAIEEAHRQGAVAILRGIADARELDPRAEIVALAPGFEAIYRDASLALGDIAAELPFDIVSGMPPDAVALSGSEAEEAVWFRLLNMGCRLPAVHVEAGSFAGGTIPAERTFVEIGQGMPATVESVIRAIRAGRVMASTGPFVFLTVDGQGPGSVFRADGAPHRLRFEAYSSTLKNDVITRLELVRNGVVIETVPGRARTSIAAVLAVRETETAWYIARARSGPKGERLAWTSPVYFEGSTRRRPRPVATRVRGRVTDADTGRPVRAEVKARLMSTVTAETESDPDTGRYEIRCSPAAELEVLSSGYAPASVRVFFHTDAPRFIRAIHTNESGRGAAVLADEATYERMRLAAGEAEIDFRLRRASEE